MPASEADALALLDRVAGMIVSGCEPLRPWDTAAPFDAALAALRRRVDALTVRGAFSPAVALPTGLGGAR